MKKLSKKQKQWSNQKSRKGIVYQSKRKKKHRHHSTIHHTLASNQEYQKVHLLNAPPNLSLFEDEEIALDFFNLAFVTANKTFKKHCIYFNFANIQYISADCVMYIIAFMNNFRRLRILNIHIEGNLPINSKARLFLEDVGFYSYVKGLRRTHPPSPKQRFQISHDYTIKGSTLAQVCDFANNILHATNLLPTKSLYNILIELVSNACQHAYNTSEKKLMDANWYIFAENMNTHIKFVFLDTGVGIPTTLWYNYKERLNKLFTRQNKDSSFIASALRGEFRTETKQGHRGKGLPRVYHESTGGSIVNMSIISGNGKCVINADGSITESNFSRKFYGTLFTWELLLV